MRDPYATCGALIIGLFLFFLVLFLCTGTTTLGDIGDRVGRFFDKLIYALKHPSEDRGKTFYAVLVLVGIPASLLLSLWKAKRKP